MRERASRVALIAGLAMSSVIRGIRVTLNSSLNRFGLRKMVKSVLIKGYCMNAGHFCGYCVTYVFCGFILNGMMKWRSSFCFV